METAVKLSKASAAMMALGIGVDLIQLLLGRNAEPLLLNIGFMLVMLVLFVIAVRWMEARLR